MPCRRFGIAADDGVAYIIVVQETPGEAVSCGCCARPQLLRLLPRGLLSGSSALSCGCCPAAQPPELPPLPPNARYVRHANECYDWGTIGWVFSTGQVVLGGDSRQADLGKGMVWQEAVGRAAAKWASPVPTAGF